jgi:hypothetical protein
VAAGETLPVPPQALDRNDYVVTLTTPCNWDQTLDNVSVKAVYADPGTETTIAPYSIIEKNSALEIPIIPLSTSAVGNQLTIKLDPSLPSTYEGKYLYHLNVDVVTTGKGCKEGFGFGFQ